jgi:hypothetical protein
VVVRIGGQPTADTKLLFCARGCDCINHTFNITDITLPNITDITLPNITDITVPNITDITVPNITNITVPNITNITVPNITNITVPNITDITVPNITNITVPNITNITVPNITNITVPKLPTQFIKYLHITPSVNKQCTVAVQNHRDCIFQTNFYCYIQLLLEQFFNKSHVCAQAHARAHTHTHTHTHKTKNKEKNITSQRMPRSLTCRLWSPSSPDFTSGDYCMCETQKPEFACTITIFTRTEHTIFKLKLPRNIFSMYHACSVTSTEA